MISDISEIVMQFTIVCLDKQWLLKGTTWCPMELSLLIVFHHYGILFISVPSGKTLVPQNSLNTEKDTNDVVEDTSTGQLMFIFLFTLFNIS